MLNSLVPIQRAKNAVVIMLFASAERFPGHLLFTLQTFLVRVGAIIFRFDCTRYR